MNIFLFLFFIGHVAADFIYRYKTKFPEPPYIEFFVGKDKQSFKTEVDINRPYSWVFSTNCKGQRCSMDPHEHVYDPKVTGGTPSKKYFNDEEYNGYNLFRGFFSSDSIKVGNLEYPVDIGATTVGMGIGSFQPDGVLGLGISDQKSSIVKRIMKDLSVKQITIQEGGYIIPKPYNQSMDSNGAYTFGRYTDGKCGAFTWFETVDDDRWDIKTDVKIGDTVYRNKIVAFLPGRMSEVPTSVLDKHFPASAPSEDAYPDISFSHRSIEYKIGKEDYTEYDPDRESNKYLGMIAFSYSTYHYDFGFGSEFLQHYCLALRFDDKLNTNSIGLAKNLESRRK